jgi:hypothetical protein
MGSDFAEQWRTAFLEMVQLHAHAIELREAALNEHLGNWTTGLTRVAVATCEAMGWKASAQGHKLNLLPVARSEYLGLDVMAFLDGDRHWRFPVAVVELENSKNNDVIAYSLWKVLSVRAKVRVVCCYRKNWTEAPALLRFLKQEVVESLGIRGRSNLEGETVVIVGSRCDSDTFPYGFFKFWGLDKNTGSFRLM